MRWLINSTKVIWGLLKSGPLGSGRYVEKANNKPVQLKLDWHSLEAVGMGEDE